MLDQFLAVSYKREQEKTASIALAQKLKEFPVEELRKLAAGDPTSKLAGYLCDSGPGSSECWLDKFKGTPLFEQAVEIERSLLAMEAQDQEQRAVSNQQWAARDALNLKKRMLDLDLVMARETGSATGAPAAQAAPADPEAQEEAGVQLLEQAQAEEQAEGKGGEPHEQAEDAAIAQFRNAQAMEQAEGEDPGAEVDTPETDPAEEILPSDVKQAPPFGGGEDGAESATKKDKGPPPKAEKGEGEDAEKPPAKAEGDKGEKKPLEKKDEKGPPPKDGEKQAGAWGSDSRRVAPGSNTDSIHPERQQGAGALPSHTPVDEHFETVTEGKQAAAMKVASVMEAGRLLARGQEKTALSHGRIIDAVRKAPEGRLGKAFEHGVGMLGKAKSSKLVDQADTLATAAGTRLGGGDWKRELTTLKALRKTSADLTQGARERIKPSNFAEPKANGPGDTGKYPIHDKSHARAALGLVGMHGSSSEQSKVRSAVAKKYPGLVSKKTASLVPALAGAVAGGQKAYEAGGSPLAGIALGGIGADAGSGLGAQAGHILGAEVSRRFGVNPALANLAGVSLGEIGGGLLGYKALTHGYNRPEEAPPAASKEEALKQAGALIANLEKDAVLGGLISAGKAALPGLAGAAKGAKSLVQTAHTAGGLPQVAKSLGNVATGFAKANPLAAAGIAGGAGLLAGRAMSSNR